MLNAKIVTGILKVKTLWEMRLYILRQLTTILNWNYVMSIRLVVIHLLQNRIDYYKVICLRRIMKVIELIIPIEPVAKARSRTSLRNGKVRSYTPERTQIAQDFIKGFITQYKELAFPPHIPIKMTVEFNRTKSKWLPKREKKPFRKSDLDNYVKLCIDAITKKQTKNGMPEDTNYLIPDDAQITTLVASKVWTDEDRGYISLILEEDIE